jgi:hypothetical protein
MSMKVKVRNDLLSILLEVRAQKFFCEAKPERRVLFNSGLDFNYTRSAPNLPSKASCTSSSGTQDSSCIPRQQKMSGPVSSATQQAAAPTDTVHSPEHGAGNHTHQREHSSNLPEHQGERFHGSEGTGVHGSQYQQSFMLGTAEHNLDHLDKDMMELSYKNTAESSKQASEIAHMLLERAELPLAFRVHAHVVLATGKTAYLHHAQEAVRFAEMGREIYGSGSTPEAQAAVADLLWQARETLRRAERDMKELEDIRKRVKSGELKVKKGEKIMYGNKNGKHSDSSLRAFCPY